MWVRLVLLAALAGLLGLEADPPKAENAPPILVLPIGGECMPRLEGGARVEGRVAEESDDPGRFGLLEAAVPGLLPAPASV